MPYERHESAITPRRNTTIWRYLNLTKFLAMLEMDTLHFTRTDLLGDAFEGSITRQDSIRWEAIKEIRPVTAQGRSTFKVIRGWTYASCWTAFEAESAAMWGLYLGTGGGVAIRSSVGRLIRSLRDHPDPILVGRVHYIDYETGGIPDGNALNPHFYKRKSFAHEREIRALLWPQSILLRDVDTTHAIPDEMPNGVDVAADLDALVDAVFVNPAAPPWFGDLVGRIVARYGRAWTVHQSDLDKDPIF